MKTGGMETMDERKPVGRMEDAASPLVSVIIPCYNHGIYLTEAIECVKNQTYSYIEIVVVDDGSSDNTKTVAEGFANVHYVYQENQGLSAARNTGVLHSKGKLLVFLDADDLLFNDSISFNVKCLRKNPNAAFASGAYDVRTMDNRVLGDKKEVVLSDHYNFLLKSNYIGMHGTVMYRRFVFDEISFDTSLKACEDYDVYLKVARKFPVIHSSKKLAIYRMHGTNMSGNNLLMLRSVLTVLGRQEKCLKNEEERKAYGDGVSAYKKYYSTHLFHQLRIKQEEAPREALSVLWDCNPTLYFRYYFTIYILKQLKKSPIKRFIPNMGLRLINKLGLYKTYRPALHKIKFGDFKRVVPFSTCFGEDRGGAIDRYYIENFLQEENSSIHGRVLEIAGNEYTLRFGGEKVVQSDILHVDDKNPRATIVGNLSHLPHVPDNSFDCIILTQTLHLIYDYKAAIGSCYRILKPGGTLLVTVPGISPIDHGDWKYTWLWSFTGMVIEKIFAEFFKAKNCDVKTYGNVYVATAFLYGMGLPEMEKKELDYNDPHFQVIITAKAIKPF